MSSGSSSASRTSGTSTEISSPTRTVCDRRAGPPSTWTSPSAISFCSLERDMSEQVDARKRSSRVPADGTPTRKRRITTSGLCLGAMSPGKIEEHAAGEEGGAETDRLRGRENARDDEAAHEVPAPDLEDPARDRVEEDIEP